MIPFLNRLPFAVSGLGLALVALGNLFKLFLIPLTFFCYFWGSLVLLLVFLKLVLTWSQARLEFQSPIIASSFAAFLMGLQLLTGVFPFHKAIWSIIALIFIFYLIWFSYRFVLKKNLRLVFPSWVIVYIGIATISISGVAYKEIGLSWLIWSVAFVFYLLLLPVILVRLRRYPLEKTQRPLLVILAAPTSLLLTAYLNLGGRSVWFAGFLLFLAQAIYLWELYQAIRILSQGFTPLWSALTFPLVISAMTLRLGVLKLGLLFVFPFLSLLEMVLALLAVSLVFFLYARFFWRKS
ncbi:SLAC1 family transporter [Streptococcus dentiloxodontae]